MVFLPKNNISTSRINVSDIIPDNVFEITELQKGHLSQKSLCREQLLIENSNYLLKQKFTDA